MMTHSVYDAVSGDKVSDHPTIASAFAAAAKLGGSANGYQVAPLSRPPSKAQIAEAEIDDEPGDDEHPGLF